MKKLLLLSLLASFLIANELEIYSPRALNKDLVALFEQQNKVKIIQSNDKLDALLEKAKQSKADILIASDATSFAKAKEAGVLAPLNSLDALKFIPANLQDKDNEFFAFATRARVIAYNKNAKNNTNLIKTYDDLAKPELKGKILMRSAKNAYSVSLLAFIIASEGEAKAKEFAKALLNNLAKSDEKKGDRVQAKYLTEDKVGEFVVMNTYYIGLLRNSKKPEEAKVGENLGVIFPSNTHVNISAVCVLKNSKNKALAQKFVEFMFSPKAQEIVMNSSYQYPVRKDITLNDTLKSFGEFKPSEISINDIIKNIAKAKSIYKELNFR